MIDLQGYTFPVEKKNKIPLSGFTWKEYVLLQEENALRNVRKIKGFCQEFRFGPGFLCSQPSCPHVSVLLFLLSRALSRRGEE